MLISGDLNARVGNKYEKCFGAIGKEGENIESSNEEVLQDFCIRPFLRPCPRPPVILTIVNTGTLETGTHTERKNNNL